MVGEDGFQSVDEVRDFLCRCKPKEIEVDVAILMNDSMTKANPFMQVGNDVLSVRVTVAEGPERLPNSLELKE